MWFLYQEIAPPTQHSLGLALYEETTFSTHYVWLFHCRSHDVFLPHCAQHFLCCIFVTFSLPCSKTTLKTKVTIEKKSLGFCLCFSRHEWKAKEEAFFVVVI